jgi:hypothetical protein
VAGSIAISLDALFWFTVSLYFSDQQLYLLVSGSSMKITESFTFSTLRLERTKMHQCQWTLSLRESAKCWDFPVDCSAKRSFIKN